MNIKTKLTGLKTALRVFLVRRSQALPRYTVLIIGSNYNQMLYYAQHNNFAANQKTIKRTREIITYKKCEYKIILVVGRENYYGIDRKKCFVHRLPGYYKNKEYKNLEIWARMRDVPMLDFA